MTENEFAYPVTARVWLDENTLTEGLVGGLTKRELFAAMAMQGLCANPYALEQAMIGISKTDEKNIFSHLAKSAVCIADSTIEALNNPKG